MQVAKKARRKVTPAPGRGTRERPPADHDVDKPADEVVIAYYPPDCTHCGSKNFRMTEYRQQYTVPGGVVDFGVATCSDCKGIFRLRQQKPA